MQHKNCYSHIVVSAHLKGTLAKVFLANDRKWHILQFAKMLNQYSTL